jgi:hypothetical protein
MMIRRQLDLGVKDLAAIGRGHRRFSVHTRVTFCSGGICEMAASRPAETASVLFDPVAQAVARNALGDEGSSRAGTVPAARTAQRAPRTPQRITFASS